MCTPSVAVIAAEARDLQPRYRDESMLNFRWRLWSGPGSFIHARLFRCYPLFNVWPPGTARPRHGPRRSGQHGRAYPRAGPQAQARPYSSRAVPAWRHDEPTVPGPAQARQTLTATCSLQFCTYISKMQCPSQKTAQNHPIHKLTDHNITSLRLQYHNSQVIVCAISQFNSLTQLLSLTIHNSSHKSTKHFQILSLTVHKSQFKLKWSVTNTFKNNSSCVVQWLPH